MVGGGDQALMQQRRHFNTVINCGTGVKSLTELKLGMNELTNTSTFMHFHSPDQPDSAPSPKYRCSAGKEVPLALKVSYRKRL